MNSAVCLLDMAAEKAGMRTAIEDEHGTITYKGLREKAMRIGTALLRRGLEPKKPVIVLLPKSIDAISSFMGIMYSGRPYVPADFKAPLARLDKIIENLDPSCIITNAEGAERLKDCDTKNAKICIFEELAEEAADEKIIENAVSSVVDSDPIYIIYTSGSTGVPKGVTIPHRGVIDYAEWVKNTFEYDENTVMASQAPFYFDNSVFDIYGTLKCMGKLVLIPDALLMFPIKLPEFLKEHEITSIFWVPTVMINVANSGALKDIELPKLKVVAFAGESMPNLQLNIWRKHLPGRVFANLYGPTEITDVCCYYIVDRDFSDLEPLPIGKACRNTRLVILRDDGTEASAGETGELCIIASSVALGYWNAPEITDKVFVRNPLEKNFYERMYKSGDLAYVAEDGLIMFVGRRDGQIKVKGNRIEIGEIEAAAMCVQGVENACAVFDAEKQNVVLFVETSGTLPYRRFNQELKKYIPPYMLPAKLVTMEKLPHTANDKIDRVRLRESLKEM